MKIRKLYYPVVKHIMVAMVSLLLPFASLGDNIDNCDYLSGAGRIVVCPNADESDEEIATRTPEDGVEQMLYGQSGSLAREFSLGDSQIGKTVTLVTKFPKEKMMQFAGARITKLRVYSGASADGKSPVTGITTSISDKLIGGEAACESYTLNSTGGWLNTCSLNTAYEITGEDDIYVGYKFIIPAGGYYIPADCRINSERDSTLLVGISDNLITPPTRYIDYSSQYGALCISLVIEGDDLPKNIVELTDIAITNYTSGGRIRYELTIRNMGVNLVNNVDIHSTTTAGADYTRKITLPQSLSNYKSTTISVTNVPNNYKGCYILKSQCVKVNGAKMADPSMIEWSYAYYNEGFPRNLLLETGTSIWNGESPAGIELARYVSEKYSDRWFVINVHDDDELTVPSYQPFLRRYVHQLPEGVVNRISNILPASGDYDAIIKAADEMFDKYAIYPAYASMEMTAEYVPESESLRIKSNTIFSCNSNVPHVLAFAIVESDMGPFMQANSYSGGAIAMNGWQTLGASVKQRYSNVARILSEFPGNSDSLPEELVEDEEYSYEFDLPTDNVMSNEFSLIGMVINTITGEVINCRKIDIIKSGVEGILTSDGDVVIPSDSGRYEEDIRDAQIWTIEGKRISGDKFKAGVYIINKDGVSKKILIR